MMITSSLFKAVHFSCLKIRQRFYKTTWWRNHLLVVLQLLIIEPQLSSKGKVQLKESDGRNTPLMPSTYESCAKLIQTNSVWSLQKFQKRCNSPYLRSDWLMIQLPAATRTSKDWETICCRSQSKIEPSSMTLNQAQRNCHLQGREREIRWPIQSDASLRSCSCWMQHLISFQFRSTWRLVWKLSRLKKLQTTKASW